MSKRASEELLGSLHEAVAKLLHERMVSGEASPADISAAIRFLKDNGIESVIERDNALGKLFDSLPKFLDDEEVHGVN